MRLMEIFFFLLKRWPNTGVPWIVSFSSRSRGISFLRHGGSPPCRILPRLSRYANVTLKGANPFFSSAPGSSSDFRRALSVRPPLARAGHYHVPQLLFSSFLWNLSRDGTRRLLSLSRGDRRLVVSSSFFWCSRPTPVPQEVAADISSSLVRIHPGAQLTRRSPPSQCEPSPFCLRRFRQRDLSLVCGRSHAPFFFPPTALGLRPRIYGPFKPLSSGAKENRPFSFATSLVRRGTSPLRAWEEARPPLFSLHGTSPSAFLKCSWDASPLFVEPYEISPFFFTAFWYRTVALSENGRASLLSIASRFPAPLQREAIFPI